MISGELIQELCDVYCGHQSDFDRNPRIRTQTHKHVPLDRISGPWNNPPRIFCYSHCLREFMQILPLLQNDFTLLSHNEDTNIDDSYLALADHPKLLFWHAQNVMFNHPKLGGLPIGIANSMWPHGNQEILSHVVGKKLEKTNSVFFNFSIWTNRAERTACAEALHYLPWQPMQEFQPYLETLATYKYAISPPGNGIDCHRIWECIYLGVIPVVLRSTFTERLNRIFPCVLLDKWSDFNVDAVLQMYIEPQYTLSFDRLKECVEQGKDFFQF
jgi:hypothetical protein